MLESTGRANTRTTRAKAVEDGRQESASHDASSGALDLEQASLYLGLEQSSRWLIDAPVPWIDMRKPGATKPLRRWLVKDLDAFLESRRVKPGHPSPFGV